MKVNAVHLYRRYTKEYIGKFTLESLRKFLNEDYKLYCKQLKVNFPKRYRDNGDIVTVSDSSIYNAINSSNGYGILLKHYYVSKDKKITKFMTADESVQKIVDYVNANYNTLKAKCRKALVNMSRSNDYSDDLVNDAVIYTMEQSRKYGAVNNIEATIVSKVKFYILDKYRLREKESFYRKGIILESNFGTEDLISSYDETAVAVRGGFNSDDGAYYEVYTEDGTEIEEDMLVRLDETETYYKCYVHKMDSELESEFEDADMTDPYVIEYYANLKRNI